MNRDHRGRFTFDKSDGERFDDRVSAIMRYHPGISRARAERQAADELKLWHMLDREDDGDTREDLGEWR